ncbi:hypothetical protein MUB24_18890 [Lederbergia sp. NSJ-179]|uniref:hypothetical protein n=1 Tax=Lederbergia sp. NSJ-179 TaxID=2931402 RepID=UPI001FD439F9|nr:hypothetical protein [Lederbergia sp. NSJ-179]MCJ7842906.1 hypothetical protein [Lederbergia sp. NSJ-179]
MNIKIVQEHQEKIRNQRQKQKEKLMAQFMKQTKETHHKQATPSPVAPLDQLEKEKKLRKKQKKEVQNLQKKLMQERQAVKELKQKVKQSEETIKKLKYDNWNITEQLSEMERLKEEVRKLKEIVAEEQAKRANLAHKITQMRAEKEQGLKAGKKMLELSNQVKQLKDSNASLRHKLKNYELLSHEEYGHLKQEVNHLQKEVQIYRNIKDQTAKNPMYLMKYMKQHMTSDHLPDLLTLLEGFISTENLQHFYRGRNNVFYLYMRRVNLLNYHLRKREYLYKIQNKHTRHTAERLGYLNQENNEWIFVDITENDCTQIYPVKENLSKHELKVDTPVKATVQEGKASITVCYPVSSNKPIDKPEKQVSKSKPSKEYAYFGPFKVLIIGSRFLSEYKKRLEQHGCLVETHNPYEESYEILKGKISRSEITLICERHVPHGIWDHVEKKQPFVNVLKKDSKDLISTNTYLTLQRCELI